MTLSRLLPNPWPGLLSTGTDQEHPEKIYIIESEAPNTCSVMSVTSRIRYCLRGHLGYATENGFTYDPAEAIQLTSHEAASQRIFESGRADLLPHPVKFEKRNERWVAVEF